MIEKKEYIEKDEFRKALLEHDFYPLFVKVVLEKMHPSDVAPVKHGKWDRNGDGDLSVYCTNCLIPQDVPTKYCPECGARMDLTGLQNE